MALSHISTPALRRLFAVGLAVIIALGAVAIVGMGVAFADSPWDNDEEAGRDGCPGCYSYPERRPSPQPTNHDVLNNNPSTGTAIQHAGAAAAGGAALGGPKGAVIAPSVVLCAYFCDDIVSRVGAKMQELNEGSNGQAQVNFELSFWH